MRLYLGVLVILGLLAVFVNGTTDELNVKTCGECQTTCIALAKSRKSGSHAEICTVNNGVFKCSCTYFENTNETGTTTGNSGTVVLMNWGTTTGIAILLIVLGVGVVH